MLSFVSLFDFIRNHSNSGVYNYFLQGPQCPRSRYSHAICRRRAINMSSQRTDERLSQKNAGIGPRPTSTQLKSSGERHGNSFAGSHILEAYTAEHTRPLRRLLLANGRLADVLAGSTIRVRWPRRCPSSTASPPGAWSWGRYHRPRAGAPRPVDPGRVSTGHRDRHPAPAVSPCR